MCVVLWFARVVCVVCGVRAALVCVVLCCVVCCVGCSVASGRFVRCVLRVVCCVIAFFCVRVVCCVLLGVCNVLRVCGSCVCLLRGLHVRVLSLLFCV